MSTLLNVAFGRPAFQSSTSIWSTEDDAAGAVSGHKSGRFSFCTADESDPWWKVDLGGCIPVQSIKIYNREDSDSDRAIPLLVEVSNDDNQWGKIGLINYIFGGLGTGNPLVLGFQTCLIFRFLRLTRLGSKRHFHLDQVEILSSTSHMRFPSQLHQDKWVLMMTGGRQRGYFLEIGSTDGITINNTIVLERFFGWKGICVEPNPDFYKSLALNRSCICIDKAMFPQSGQTLQFIPNGEFGTIQGYEAFDHHKDMRQEFLAGHETIPVETMNPNEMLGEVDAPKLIEYLSLDTEGSEYDILSAIDLSVWHFGLITIEHNYVEEKRNAIHSMLSGQGYERMAAQFDDWYFNRPYMDVLNGALPVDYDAVLGHFENNYDYKRM